LGIILKWWSDGETNAIEVYRKQPFARLIFVLALILAVYWSPVLKPTWYLFPMLAGGVAWVFVQRRRAIIFTDGALLYRPAVASPIRVALADVVSVEPCKTWVNKTGRLSSLVEALCFQLKTGEQIKIPLDFPKSEVIKERILNCDYPSMKPQHSDLLP
jgi:hypothetical protein